MTGKPYNLDFSEVPMFKSGISVLYDAMVKVHNRIGDSPNPNRELKEQFDRLLRAAMGHEGGTAGLDKFVDPRVAKTLNNKIPYLIMQSEKAGKDDKTIREDILAKIEGFAYTRG